MLKNGVNLKRGIKALAVVFAIGYIFSFTPAQAATTIGANITTDGYLKIGTAVPGVPVVGMIYYDSGTNKFRCYEGAPAGWVDCIGAVSGTIPVSQGGTNITLYTAGDLLYATGATTLSKLAVGLDGQILKSNGTAPVWTSADPLVLTNTYVHQTLNGADPCTGQSAALVGDVCIALTDNKTYILRTGVYSNQANWSELLADKSQYLLKSSNLTDVADTTTARGNLGAAARGANSDITSLSGLTTALSIGQGGTGVTGTPTNGQLLIGNGTGYTLATLTATSNQVNITNAAGSITLSTPQNIHTGATPQFAGLTLTGNLNIDNQTELRLSELDANGTNYIALKSPAALAGDLTYTLPAIYGSNGQVLTTNGTGGLSWTSAGGGGEVNTASNQGVGGVGLFDTKSGVDLQFKNINVGSNKLSVTNDVGNKEVDLDVNEANLSLNNIGGTLGVTKGGTGQTTYTDGQLLIGNSTGNTLAKSTLTAGSGISITNGSGTITIAATGGPTSLTDNTTDAYDLQEGTNNYININTTDLSENISFGNATTNPAYAFLGSGGVTISSLGVGIVHSSAAGVLSSSAVNLASVDVTGNLPDSNLATITTANKVSGSAVQLSANGGLVNNTGLSLLTSCSNNQVLAWNSGTSAWVCTTPTTGVTDHGALTGLGDDDHTQYGALAQNETITGNWVNTANPWAVNEGGTGLATFGGTNTLLYTTTADTLSSITTANNGVLITSGAGVPSIATTLPTTVQGNITSVGTIGSGTWNGSIIGPTYGGTGINNGASTITLGGNLTTSGANALTLTTTGATNVTLPTSGTLMVNPMTGAGEIIYGGVSGVATALAAGTSGYLLQANGAAAPNWLNVSGWDQNASDDLTTSSGLDNLNDVTLGGVAGGDILWYNGTNTRWENLADGTSGQVLTSNGTGGLFWTTPSTGVTDHGALTGLGDDDHTQYGELSQNETIAGNWVNTANPWSVNEGGTGAATFTANGIIYGNTTGALQVTAAGTDGQLLLGVSSGAPTFATMSSDATISNAGVLTISSDAVALTTDTTGNYVATITNGNGISGSASSEGATPTLSLNLLSTPANGLSTTTNSASGMEFTTGQLSMLQGCADGELLKWDETNDYWYCAADITSGGVGVDSLDFTEFKDIMALDAATTINLASATYALTFDANVNTTTFNDAIVVTTSGTTTDITDAIDVSDADIVNALNIGANTITGTTGVIDFTNFDVSGAGVVTAGSTINGLTLSSTTLSAVGALSISSAGGSALTLQAGSGTVSLGTSTNLTAAGSLTIDSNTTSALSFGTGANAKTITIGNTQAGTALVLDAGATNGITITSNATLNAQSDMRFADADSSNWVAIQAPATISTNYTLTLPTDDGTASQVLTTDGSGVLSWAIVSGSMPSGTTTDSTLRYNGSAWVENTSVLITSTGTISGSGALTINSNTTNALTLDSGTTGAVNLGTGNNAKTINIGTGTAGNAINIGTNNTVADTISIGSALDIIQFNGNIRKTLTDNITATLSANCGVEANRIVLTSDINIISVSVNNADCAALPQGAVGMEMEVIVTDSGQNVALYPPSGSTINGTTSLVLTRLRSYHCVANTLTSWLCYN